MILSLCSLYFVLFSDNTKHNTVDEEICTVFLECFQNCIQFKNWKTDITQSTRQVICWVNSDSLVEVCWYRRHPSLGHRVLNHNGAQVNYSLEVGKSFLQQYIVPEIFQVEFVKRKMIDLEADLKKKLSVSLGAFQNLPSNHKNSMFVECVPDCRPYQFSPISRRHQFGNSESRGIHLHPYESSGSSNRHARISQFEFDVGTFSVGVHTQEQVHKISFESVQNSDRILDSFDSIFSGNDIENEPEENAIDDYQCKDSQCPLWFKNQYFVEWHDLTYSAQNITSINLSILMLRGALDKILDEAQKTN